MPGRPPALVPKTASACPRAGAVLDVMPGGVVGLYACVKIAPKGGAVHLGSFYGERTTAKLLLC